MGAEAVAEPGYYHHGYGGYGHGYGYGKREAEAVAEPGYYHHGYGHGYGYGYGKRKPSLVTITMDMVTDTMVKRSAVYLLSCKTSVNLNLIENNLVKRNTPQKEIQNLDVEKKKKKKKKKKS